jgi:hypothetical protein
MALMRRTRVFRTVGWLVCQVIEVPDIDAVDQAALDAHIAALAERDAEGACPPEPGPLNAAPWLEPPAQFRLAAQSDHARHTAGAGLAKHHPPRSARWLALIEPGPLGVARWSDRIKFRRASPTARARSDRA